MRMCRHKACLLAVLFTIAVQQCSCEDTPFMQVPLPRSVTQMEHRLGVSDNTLPDGRHTKDKSQFALSSYDQQILAHGPPGSDTSSSSNSNSNAYAGQQQQQQPAASSWQGYQQQQPQQQSYPQPSYAYPQTYTQQPSSAYNNQNPNGYQPQQQQQQQYAQYAQPQQQQYAQYGQYEQPQQQQYYPAQQTAVTGGVTAGPLSSGSGAGDAYSKFGWHPTLSRELGIPKGQRADGPRLHLQGQLANMKAQQVPKKQPSVDPQQKSVAAVKLAKAQALLRKSVGLGLQLHGTAAEKKRALGRDPCRSLKCEKKRYAELKERERKERHAAAAAAVTASNRGSSAQAKAQQRLALKHEASRRAKAPAARFATSNGAVKQAAVAGGKEEEKKAAAEQALAGKVHTEVKPFAFPTPPPAAPKVKRAGPIGTMAMSILLLVFVGLMAMTVVVACVHARRESKRHAMQAMDSFADP